MCKKSYAYLAGWAIAVLICLQALSAGAQSPGAKKYREAEAARKKRQYESAIGLYDQAILAEPNNAKYYFRKGQCESKLKDPKMQEAAIGSFEKAVQYNPGLTSGYIMLFKLYAKNKDSEKALKNLRLAYEKETDQSNKVKYKILSSRYYLTLDNPQQALNELRDAKQLAPTDMRVLHAEGEVNGKLGQWSQALDSYTKALEISKKINMSASEQAKYKYGVGLSYCKLNKQDEYKKVLDDLEAVPSTKLWGRRLKAACAGKESSKGIRLALGYLAASEYDEAKKWINQAIESKDNLAKSYYVAAFIARKSGETSTAISYFAKAAQEEKDPKQLSRIYQSMVKLQFNNHDYQGALATAEKILQKKSNDAGVLFLKAQAEYHLQKYANCMSTIDQSMTFLPGNTTPDKKAVYYFVKGLAAKKSGKDQIAKEAFTQAQASKKLKAAAMSELQALGAR